jgi:glycosyltransferase involved in cell wall biosynthesis
MTKFTRPWKALRRRTVGDLIARYSARALPAEKTVTAMMRVKNEAEFLEAAVLSVAQSVDEIVIVDNASSDDTPRIIERMVASLPHVRAYYYPYAVGRVGAENAALVHGSSHRAGGLRRLSEFYNFSLAQCASNWVLKWDGDMIATDALIEGLAQWRSGSALTVSYSGANVHPDFFHLIGPRVNDEGSRRMRDAHGRQLPPWTEQMSWTAKETWLFPRLGACYIDDLWWERLRSPFLPQSSSLGHDRNLELNDPGFLHLKYCKRNPHANQSEHLAEALAARVGLGPVMTEVQVSTLEKWLPTRKGPEGSTEPLFGS